MTAQTAHRLSVIDYFYSLKIRDKDQNGLKILSGKPICTRHWFCIEPDFSYVFFLLVKIKKIS